MPSVPAHADHPQTNSESVKETLISIIIAFVLAFVFRGFVIEAFIIPTGSMAPTLLGAHMRFRSASTGEDWAVEPWDYQGSGDDRVPLPVEGAPPNAPINVHDPITGEVISQTNVRSRSGDRILVLKYLYALLEPERFDVVVFKCPYQPSVNFIKRLIGLPGEDIALVDGDVFVRDSKLPATPGKNAWEQDGWHIARKPVRVQRAVWQQVFDSSRAPAATGAKFSQPWVGEAGEWTEQPGGVFVSPAAGAARLRWDASATFIEKPNLFQRPVPAIPGKNAPISREITDRYAYDEAPDGYTINEFPVSDVRVRAGVRPAKAGQSVVIELTARGHLYRGEIDSAGNATVKMRALPTPENAAPAWETLENAVSRSVGPLPAGVVTNIEFWHVDQSLQLWVNGACVASGEYNWTPSQRLAFATHLHVSDLSATGHNLLTQPEIYDGLRPRLQWEFDGPVTLYRVSVDRDIHYQAATDITTGKIARATHPLTTLTLEPDQFFVCGDNSPLSADGRLWNTVDPWVDLLMKSRGMNNTIGVVPRDLMLGKAFFVYFPGLTGDAVPYVPDFGRMRFIQ